MRSVRRVASCARAAAACESEAPKQAVLAAGEAFGPRGARQLLVRSGTDGHDGLQEVAELQRVRAAGVEEIQPVRSLLDPHGVDVRSVLREQAARRVQGGRAE